MQKEKGKDVRYMQLTLNSYPKHIFQPLHHHIHTTEERLNLNTMQWKFKIPLELKPSMDFCQGTALSEIEITLKGLENAGHQANHESHFD